MCRDSQFAHVGRNFVGRISEHECIIYLCTYMHRYIYIYALKIFRHGPNLHTSHAYENRFSRPSNLKGLLNLILATWMHFILYIYIYMYILYILHPPKFAYMACKQICYSFQSERKAKSIFLWECLFCMQRAYSVCRVLSACVYIWREYEIYFTHTIWNFEIVWHFLSILHSM